MATVYRRKQAAGKNEKNPASKRRTLRVSETATVTAKESNKQTLRTLLQTKHATPIKQRAKAHGMDMRVPDENTAGQKTAPALQQPNERQKCNKQNTRKNAKCYKHTP